jgi:hypothetical protein
MWIWWLVRDIPSGSVYSVHKQVPKKQVKQHSCGLKSAICIDNVTGAMNAQLLQMLVDGASLQVLVGASSRYTPSYQTP